MVSVIPTLEKLCEEVLSPSGGIPDVGAIKSMGKIVASRIKQGKQSKEHVEVPLRLFPEFAPRHEMKKDFDQEFGKATSGYAERERIKLASFPFNRYLIKVSIEREVDNSNDIKDIPALPVQRL